MSVQLFRYCDEFNERFSSWTARIKNLQGRNLARFFDTIAESKTYGYFIWDNNLSDLAQFFTREYFADNWTAILSAFRIAGTFEAYILVIQSALGASTTITFAVPEASHLIISIQEPTGSFGWGAWTAEQLQTVIPDQTQYPDDVMIFQQSITGLTVSETVKLIELLNVNGVFVEIEFTV